MVEYVDIVLEMQKTLEQKLVAVGDKKCGKSSLLVRMSKQIFLEGYVPTLFENYPAEVESSQGLVQVSIYDTPGGDDYSHLRPLFYPDTDILLLCFDLSSSLSYQNIFSKWIPEVKRECQNVSLYIIGCKSDLRGKHPSRFQVRPPSNHGEITNLIAGSGVCGYFESSAKSGTNVSEILCNIINSRMSIYRSNRKKSLILRKRLSIDFGRIEIRKISTSSFYKSNPELRVERDKKKCCII